MEIRRRKFSDWCDEYIEEEMHNIATNIHDTVSDNTDDSFLS